MKKNITLLLFLQILVSPVITGQDLDQILKEMSENKSPDFTFGTFKGTTIINGQSVEVPGKSDINFLISHRFGQVNQGIYTFFGLDQGTTRLALEYGLGENASLAIGRNNMEKTYDGGFKIKLFRQQTGLKNIPVSVSLFTSFYLKTLKWEIPERDNLFSSRFSYVSQFLIARKFNQKFSMQLSPSYIHKNLVPNPEDQNDIFAAGLGGRHKIGPKFSLNGEYFYLLPGETAENYSNSLSLGFDIEAAGHVFQLQFTNSQLMFARGFITETTGKWTKGDIYFGFNIYRVFSLNKNKRKTN